MALAAGWPLTSLTSKSPTLLGHGEAEGLLVIFQFLLFHWRDLTQQSSLFLHFSLVQRCAVA